MTTVAAFLVNLSMIASGQSLPAIPGNGFQIINPDQAGNQSRLTTSYWGNGWAVLDFWAVWCQPCMEKLPELNRSAQTLRQRGVRFIGMSIDERTGGAPDADIVRNQLRQLPLTYPTALVPRDYRQRVNAMVAGTGVSQASYRMNIPLMLVVRGNRVVRVITGGHLTQLERAADAQGVAFNRAFTSSILSIVNAG